MKPRTKILIGLYLPVHLFFTLALKFHSMCSLNKYNYKKE